MGNKMTSTPYGLKVKEHTNHADYKDVFDKTVFKIYYNESTHVWSIIANYDRLWSEGIQYNVGDTILSFTNTSNQEKTVLGQYDQEGTEVYRNIMYRIKCYQGEAGEGRTKQLIQITGGYSPKTYDKETVCTDILHTHVSVYYNGKWHKAMYLVYDNASIAGCWMKKVGSLAITYAYPYWFLMCTKAGLKQGDRTYTARELIRSWSQDDYINMSFKEYKIRSKTKLGKGSYEKGEYLVKTIPSEDSIEVDFIVNGKIENKDTIILGISDVPYDFYNIRINYESNEWSLISINGHISYNKHNYKKDAVICTLNKDEQITVTLIDNNDRYEKQQELNNDYEETVYDIVGLPDATYITVKNQTVVQELNPETGRTEKVYIDFDEKTIYQSDIMPVDFYNIRFIYTSSDNKWTIYSLCDYIKYGGRTYTKNKSILSFGTDEYDPEDPHPEVHLEIKDETEKYEIESTTTYTVKSVQVSNVSYKLWTVTIDKSLKIEKTVDTTVEPWISLRYYEAMYEPVVIDDLILEFSNVDMKWYLKSNNDNLYCSGTNYQKGELITYWDYDYIQNLKYITVLSSSSEYGIELKKLTSGDVPYISEDIDEIYDEGIKICYSASKGLWEIVSVDDETYHNGIQFLEGQTIVSFKDKTILDQFTILVKKIIPGEEEYDNVMYTCYTGVDLINGITTLTVNGMSWANKTATDANKSTIVTKDMARSMYGYIWQKEETPPVPTWDIFDFIVFRDDAWNTRYVRVRVENNQLIWDHGTLLSWSAYAYCWGLGLFNNAYFNECYLSNSYNGYKITFNEYGDPQLTTYNNFYKIQQGSDTDWSWMIGVIDNGTSICMRLELDGDDYSNYKWYIHKWVANSTNDMFIETRDLVGEHFYDISATDDRDSIKCYLINHKLYFVSTNAGWMGRITIFIADESNTYVYDYGDEFVDNLSESIKNIYPQGNGYYTMLDGGHLCSFEHNGYIYQFIMHSIGLESSGSSYEHILKPALVKINALDGTWQLVTLENTDIYLDTPGPDFAYNADPVNLIVAIESNDQLYLYVTFHNNRYGEIGDFSKLYIYKVDFGNDGIQINRRNWFDGETSGHDYVNFKYGGNTARCYPTRNSNLIYNSDLGCYVFGTYGDNINRRGYLESNLWCDNTVRYSGGLLSNYGKSNYIIGNYGNTNTTMFIAKLQSLDLTPGLDNEVFTVG